MQALIHIMNQLLIHCIGNTHAKTVTTTTTEPQQSSSEVFKHMHNTWQPVDHQKALVRACASHHCENDESFLLPTHTPTPTTKYGEGKLSSHGLLIPGNCQLAAACNERDPTRPKAWSHWLGRAQTQAAAKCDLFGSSCKGRSTNDHRRQSNEVLVILTNILRLQDKILIDSQNPPEPICASILRHIEQVNSTVVASPPPPIEDKGLLTAIWSIWTFSNCHDRVVVDQPLTLWIFLPRVKGMLRRVETGGCGRTLLWTCY